MHRCVAYVLLCGAAVSAQTDPVPDPVLEGIRARLKQHFATLPSYTCVQTIHRLQRPARQPDLQLKDTIRLDVALINNREQFSWPNAKRFDDRELRDMIGKGMVGTGNFALHTKQVFHPGAADFKRRAETTYQGRPAIQYDYEVPWENSRYHIGMSGRDEIVAFRGSFLIDAETFDLLRLEVLADEIPPELELDRVVSILEYAPVKIGAGDYLLPKRSELSMVALDGSESRNRIELTACRQYSADSKLVFDDPAPAQTATAETPDKASAEIPEVTIRGKIEIALDSDILLGSATVGDAVTAVLVRPFKVDERVIAPEGSQLRGRIVRLDKQSQPFPYYEVGIEFDTLAAKDSLFELNATLEDAGPASGLIRQEKRMNPTFTASARRQSRLNVLARGVQRGQGVLQWEAKHPKVGKGLRMRWRVDDMKPSSAEQAAR
jgi:hypothetical protein